ncbi:MAG TPA: histidine kinase [Pilimelia sp.]|nr:histidine kinase [Pilimelia sp.]
MVRHGVAAHRPRPHRRGGRAADRRGSPRPRAARRGARRHRAAGARRTAAAGRLRPRVRGAAPLPPRRVPRRGDPGAAGPAAGPVAGPQPGDTWRQFAYHLFAMPANAAAAAVLAFTWSAGLLLTLAPLHTGLPAGEPGSPARPIPAVLTLVAVGVALLAVAPWLAAGLTAVDLRVARALLGPSRRAELTRRVATLARSRADLVEAADAERRRIERDLHDGMQQRLVALAMNLGLARASFPDAPDPVRDALARSHDDAKQALAELRAVVRGLYPAVLDDRGLDAALSGIVARSPVPARLAVDLHRRPPAQVEAVAYFVVAESLANVAKHARASRVDVRVALPAGGDRLRVSVTDDGRGGARPERGTGLRGLAQRVASVDGSLRVDSPDGGPTTILVELPCGS